MFVLSDPGLLLGERSSETQPSTAASPTQPAEPPSEFHISPLALNAKQAAAKAARERAQRARVENQSNDYFSEGSGVR